MQKGISAVPSIELTDEQALRLWEQLPEEQKKRILSKANQNGNQPKRPKPQFGSGKDAILHISDDFYEPVEGFEDYQ
jgi:hypothetical protein